MRAVIYDSFGGPPTVQEVPDPAARPRTGWSIRVEATGLCRSDWHGWMGHDPDITLPHVPGHELAGVVAAVGPGVTGWRAGDRVTVPFVCALRALRRLRAPATSRSASDQTQPGFTHWGSFAEYVALDHADVNLVPLPDELGFARPPRARLPVRHRVPRRRRRAGSRPGEWVGGARLRRRRPVRGDDRGGAAARGSSPSTSPPAPWTWPGDVRRRRRAWTRRPAAAGRGGPRARPAAARTCPSTPSAAPATCAASVAACAAAAGTSRSACCPAHRGAALPMDRVIALSWSPRQPRHGRPRLRADV